MMVENNAEIEMEKLVEEYEKQLELMKKQYGQEEDLYPWIYMLLLKSGKINDLSMRQVAGAPWANCVRGREMLRGYAGFPDIAILDKDFCAINVSKSIKYKIEDIKEWISLFDKENNDIPKKINSNKDTKDFLREYWYMYNIDKIRGCIEVKVVGDYLINIKPGKSTLVIESTPKGSYIFNVGGENCISSSEKGIKFEDLVQLFGELLWYGNVLYTNGKEWRYLQVTKCNKDKEISNIVDLRKILYGSYVKIHYPKEKWYKQISQMQNDGLNIEIKCEIKSDKEDLALWIKEKVNFEVLRDEY